MRDGCALLGVQPVKERVGRGLGHRSSLGAATDKRALMKTAGLPDLRRWHLRVT